MSKVSSIVTREWLAAKVAENPQLYVGRALVAIYKRQTDDEQNSSSARYKNGVGFSSNDAVLGSKCARHYQKYGHLLPWQLRAWLTPNEKGEPRICKYTTQLDAVAQAKAKPVSSAEFNNALMENDYYRNLIGH